MIPHNKKFDTATVVSRHPSTSYFHKVMTLDIMTRLNSTSQLTLFLPVDEAWNVLDPVERLYLESEFATDDLNRILNMHAVVQDDVKWSESFDPALNRKILPCISFLWLISLNSHHH